jgi:hypothetical protein
MAPAGAASFSPATTRWSLHSVPEPAGTVSSYLRAVSCTSPSRCTAVGGYYDSTVHTNVTFGAKWNGTSWSAEDTANPSGDTSSFLSGISCPSATMCAAVGYYQDSGNLYSLAEVWNSSGWSVKTSATVAGQLFAVSCTSSNACTAVGMGASGTLVEVWNGTAWTDQASPNPAGTSNDQLQGVSCSSSAACAAVGWDVDAGRTTTLLETWNGKTWSIHPTPSTVGEFYAVSCKSASSCVAVGEDNMVALWNGASWSIQSAPNPTGATSANLNAVACTSARACTAVGAYQATVNGAMVALPYAEAWNGTWSVEDTPNPTARGYLYGVSFCSATTFTAVGSYFPPSGLSLAMAERN